MDSGRSRNRAARACPRDQLEAMPARIACTEPRIAWQRSQHLARLLAGRRTWLRYTLEYRGARRVVAVELHARRILGRPGGWTVELHCGSCARPCRTLYLAPLGGPACRRCVGAAYRSNCTRGSIAWQAVGRPAARAVRILRRLASLPVGRRALAELAELQKAVAAARAGFAAIKAEPTMTRDARGLPHVHLQTFARLHQAERAMRELVTAYDRARHELLHVDEPPADGG